jgi:hypothetical protein
VREVERQVVSARDKVKPLVLGAGFEVADDVASQVEQNPAEVGDGEDGDVDVFEFVDPGGVVRFVEVLVGFVVLGLIPSERDQFLLGQGSFKAFGTCTISAHATTECT